MHSLSISDVDFLSIYFLASSLIAIFVCRLVFDLPARCHAVLVMSFVFLFYKVNHIQF